MSTVTLLRKTDESERSPEVRRNVLFDRPRIERAVCELLFAVGEDSDRDGLVETPRRLAPAYAELLAGLSEDPAQPVGRVLEPRTDNDDLVLVRDIEFSSLCEDVQTRGPYALWHHTHEFEPADGGTVMRDRVCCRLPFGALDDLVAGWMVRRDLEAVFDFRRRQIRELLS